MDDSALGQQVTVHRFFKGCTRPAMFAGVPLMAFLAVTGAFLLLGVWCFYVLSAYVSLMLILVYLPIVAVMRQITKADDQRLRHVFMRARMRYRHFNKGMWGALSFSPLRYKKRS